MTKKQAVLIILTSIVLSIFANVLFGRWLGAKLSTWPVLNHFKLISPQGPIVINTREQVRVNDSADVLQAISSVRPKLSLAVSTASNQLTILGGAINVTSDGLFITTKSVIANQKPENIKLKLDDGTLSAVLEIVPDPATNLVILKTGTRNVPVAAFSDSKDVVPGQRLIFIEPTLTDSSPVFDSQFISQSQNNSGQRDSDSPTRSFKIGSSFILPPGQALANTNGEVVGLWDGKQIISSDVIKDLINNYFENRSQIVRPSFGFSYNAIAAAESKLLGQPEGARVTGVTPASAAQKAGLLAGDVIQKWGSTELTENISLEDIFQSAKPGDAISLLVTRGKNQLNLNLTAGQLK